MKKIYLLLLILNNIAFSCIISASILSNSNNTLLCLGVIIFYLGLTIKILKTKRNIEKLDIITISIYMIFVISILLYSIIYQNSNSYLFTMFYFGKILIIPNILINIYNLFN